jgi:hypothetical protein
MSTRDKWAVMENILSQYEVTSLPELSHVALLDRVDTKYVMTLNQLYQALHQLKSQYRVLDIKGRRLNQYQTLYFDTANFDLYRQHHNKWGNRYKIHTRQYVEETINTVFTPEQTTATYEKFHNLIAPYVTGEATGSPDMELDSVETFENSLNQLIEQVRYTLAQEYLSSQP